MVTETHALPTVPLWRKAAIVLLVAGGLWAAWPADIDKLNGLGYASVCPFAPWSTLMMCAAAAALWPWRRLQP